MELHFSTQQLIDCMNSFPKYTIKEYKDKFPHESRTFDVIIQNNLQEHFGSGFAVYDSEVAPFTKLIPDFIQNKMKYDEVIVDEIFDVDWDLSVMITKGLNGFSQTLQLLENYLFAQTNDSSTITYVFIRLKDGQVNLSNIRDITLYIDDEDIMDSLESRKYYLENL